VTSALAVLASVIPVGGLLKIAPGPFAAQTTPENSRSRPAPTTSWGEPDLQGIWTDDYQTPLQRPEKYAGKEFFTDHERSALDKSRAGAPRQNDVGIATKSGRLPSAEDPIRRHAARRDAARASKRCPVAKRFKEKM
jgi:hypothetical protein